MPIRCLIALLLLPAWAAAEDLKTAAETLGVTRVLVPAGTTAADLVKAEGTLIEMPIAALESRLQRAVLQEASAKRQPRLVKAVYRAELVGNSLSSGTGNWLIEHPGASPAILPLTPFNLALKQPRLSGAAAILGDLEGANLGLWIEKTGTQTLVFDWSLRGTPGVHGVTFDLKLPPCPLIALDFKLPTGDVVSLPKSAGMLTGPLDTENPAFKLWRLQVTGRSQIELLVRRGSERGQTAQLFTSCETRVQFSPEQTLYEYDAQIEALHAPVSELVYDIDAALQPNDIASRQNAVQSWRVEPAANGRALLKIQLRDPLLGAVSAFRMRFVGPRWGNQEAMLPRIELVGAVCRGETLKLHLHPDQHLERWDAGAFRLINSATDADGSQVMTLADLRLDGRGAWPRFLLRTQGVDFTVNQDTRWRIEPGSMSLASELQYDISRGQLFELDVRLPKNAPWRVVSVDMQPRDALQKWTVAGGVLHVDLQRGITPRTDCKLNIVLQDDRDKSLLQTKVIDFPDLEPIGSHLRQGSLAILADAHQRVALVQSNLPTSSPDPALAKDPRLQFFFAFRQTPLSGKVRLSPQQPVLQARVQEQVTLTPEAARVTANITVEPILGQPTYIDLFFSGGGNGPWQIDAKGIDIASRERLTIAELASLGLRLGSAPARPAPLAPLLEAGGEAWRVHFREPLTKAAVLIAHRKIGERGDSFLMAIPPPMLALDCGIGLAAETMLGRTHRDWRIPIVVPLDAERVEGELSLQPLGISLRNVQSHGLEAAAKGAPGLARLYRFKHTGLLDAPYLVVKTHHRPNDEAAQAIIDLAELTASVDPAGNVTRRLRLSVWNWRAREFRLTLPPQSTLLGARLNQIDLDRVARADRAEGSELYLPMTDDHAAQTIEIAYRDESKPWFGSLGRGVDMPLPLLPTAPLVVRRELTLAPGWLPLRQEEWFSIDRTMPARAALRCVWNLGSELVDEVLLHSAPPWVEPQRLSLLGAEGALHRTGVREMPLSEAFARLLFDAKGEPPVIVLDRAACRARHITPETIATFPAEASMPFWEKLGLIYVPTPHGALLTSKEHASNWSRAIRDADPTGVLLTAAVDQAARLGQDASGRFCAADEWLRNRERSDAASAQTHFAAERTKDTTWQPQPDAATSLVVVRGGHIRGLGAALGFVLFAAGLAGQRFVAPATFFRAVWVALLACLVGLTFIPAAVREIALAPSVAVGVLIVLAYRRLLQRDSLPNVAGQSSRSSKVAVKTGAGLAVALGMWSLAAGQGPQAKVVYLIKDADDIAFASPGLVRWLDELDKQSRPAVDDAVILSAQYDARLEPAGLKVRADFELYAFKDRASLLAPLTGVDLLPGSQLGDAPAYPVVASGGKSGYQIDLPNKGFHKLTLSFNVRATNGDFKFNGPRTPCSSLRLIAPAKAGAPRLARCQGEETLRSDAKTGEQIFEAQLGGEAAIQIQGLAESGATKPANLQVRELYFWDLRPGNRSTQAVLAYTAAGEVNHVDVQLPPTLEVRSVELAETAARKRGAAVKTWSVTPPRGEARVLRVEFVQPISGAFQVALAMTPRSTNAAGVFDLRLPFPLHASFGDGMIGVRVDEADAVEKAQFLGVAAAAPEAFVKEWARLAEREIGTPLHAFSFARATKNAAAAALEVTPLTARPHVQMDVMWTAQVKTIDLVAKLNIAAVDEVFMLPIHLPENIVLRDVQGADVHHWSRQGGTLQVWLIGPRKKTSVTLVGWSPNSSTKATINLPAPSLPGAIAEPATLSLASAAGYSMEPKAPPTLIDESVDSGLRRYRSPTGQLPNVYQLRPEASEPHFQTLTTAEVHDGVCTIATHLLGRIDHGNYPELHIRQSNWPTSSPRLLLSAPGARIKHGGSPSEHWWTITLPPGTAQQFSLSITGQTPIKAGATAPLPQLKVTRGGQLDDSFVALTGAHPAVVTPLKLAIVRSSTKDLSPWPLEHARLRAAGAQYARRSGDAPLFLQPAEDVAAPAARALAAHHRIVLADGDAWLHHMTWSLLAKSGHDVEIALPPGAVFAAAFVDGQPATPSQPAPELLSLPVLAGTKPRSVELYWRYAPGAESLSKPRLTPATLTNLEGVAVIGSLHVPPGLTAASPIAPVEILLADARAEVRALAAMGEDLATAGRAGQAPLVSSLQAFALLSRQSQYRIRLSDPHRREKLQADLKALNGEEQKQAKTLGMESSRLAAERSPWLAPPRPWFPGADRGAPIGWLAPADIVLRSSDETAPTLPFLPVAILVFAISFWPAALRTWIASWPEQLAALVVIGFAASGFSFVGAGLLIFAMVGRGLSVVQIATGQLRRVRGLSSAS